MEAVVPPGGASESDILAVLSGRRMVYVAGPCVPRRSSRPQCAGGVLSVVFCGVRGLGGAGRGRGPGSHLLRAIHWHWGGRQASHWAHSVRHSPQPRVGLWALCPRGSSVAAKGR